MPIVPGGGGGGEEEVMNLHRERESSCQWRAEALKETTRSFFLFSPSFSAFFFHLWSQLNTVTTPAQKVHCNTRARAHTALWMTVGAQGDFPHWWCDAEKTTTTTTINNRVHTVTVTRSKKGKFHEKQPLFWHKPAFKGDEISIFGFPVMATLEWMKIIWYDRLLVLQSNIKLR